MATDPAYQAAQAKNPWGALTFEQTLQRLRNPPPVESQPKTTFELSLGDAEERSAHVNFKKAAEPKADLPSTDAFDRNVETIAICCEVVARLLIEATSKQRPEVLLELLLEDLQHVQQRQQVLLRAEMAAAINPPKQTVARVACNDVLSESILRGEMKIIVTDEYKKIARHSW